MNSILASDLKFNLATKFNLAMDYSVLLVGKIDDPHDQVRQI